MNISRTRIAKVIALLLTFVSTQVFFGLSFAAPGTDSRAANQPQKGGAVLTTQGSNPVSVNGSSSASGATILSGATIETPGGTLATVTIPGQAILLIPGNTKVLLEFDQSGNVRVTILIGCVVLTTKKGNRGEVYNSMGLVGKSDGKNDATIDTCQVTSAPVSNTGGGGGLSGGAKAAIAAAVIGGGVGLAFGLRGSNPSPSSPR